MHLYPSEKETSFDLYHDDGLSLDYKQGVYDLIRIGCHKNADQVHVKLTTVHHGLLNENPTTEFTFIVHDSSSIYPELKVLYEKGTQREVILTSVGK